MNDRQNAMRGLLVSACAGLFAAACGGASPPAETSAPVPSPPVTVPSELADGAMAAPDQAQDQTTIVMLGDSLVAGFGLAEDEALPARIEARLETRGIAVNMINAGVSGDTSAGGLARYDWSVASAQPDLLVLALGANDYLNGIDAAQTRANLSAIIERAQADSIPVLLLGLSARSSAEDNPRAADFAAIYPELAEAYAVPLYEGLVDAIQDRPDLLMQDGLHPTVEGVQIIAQPLARTIAELLDGEP